MLTGLNNLERFSVDSNQLTGTIPGLSGLAKLRQFFVGGNRLTGSIPSLAGLTNLQVFSAERNQLTGWIPALTDLTALEVLIVSENQLSGSIPALRDLTRLVLIQVDYNQLSGDVPSVPSPNALLAGYSILCPNALNLSPDLNWDFATGQTPWYTGCGPAFGIAAASRKIHGAGGTFDLPLSLVPPWLANHDPTTEPRHGPTHSIVFTFDKAVAAAAVAVVEGSAIVDMPTVIGKDVIVTLSGVADQQYVRISLDNVVSFDGYTGGGGSVRMGFLLGDVNQSRVVSLADLALVNAQLTRPLTAENFLGDINASGGVTLADKGITNANLTRALPPP
jgi:hypothetical protein